MMAKMPKIPVNLKLKVEPEVKTSQTYQKPDHKPGVKIPPIKLKDLVNIMGEDFEVVFTRMHDPTRQGIKLAEVALPMNTEEATTLLLALQHYGEVGLMPVDESAQLSELDELDKELGEIDG